MVETNLRIIEELKQILETISTDGETRKLFVSRETDFTRERKLTMEKIVGILINLPKRSLGIEIREFFGVLGQGNRAATKGAFSLQRGKLLPLFFHVWNSCLAELFYRHYGDSVRRWRGFRLLAVDGSTVYLPRTKELAEEFGTQDNQYTQVPMARAMQVHDVLNDLVLRGDIFPMAESERAILAKWTTGLYTDSLTMFDRGFPAFATIYLLTAQETPRHFVMRCKLDFNNEVRCFAEGSSLSETTGFRPGRKAIDTLWENGYHIRPDTTVKVRMVKVGLPTGETEVLLTNLYDAELYTVEDLAYLYGLRWGVETAFGSQKNQQQIEQFSGHRAICIRQDYAADLFVANLQSLIAKQCGQYLEEVNRRRKHDYKINGNISWASLKHNIVRLFLDRDPGEILVRLQGEFQENLEPIRPGRNGPRIKRSKRLKGKYQTLTNYRRAI